LEGRVSCRPQLAATAESFTYIFYLLYYGYSDPPVDFDNDLDLMEQMPVDSDDDLDLLEDLEQQAAAAAAFVAQAAVEQSAVDWQDLERLVSCCPALQTCDLGVQPDVELSALQRLTNLQALSVWNVGDNRTLDSLSALTQLHSLTIRVSGEYTTCISAFTLC
jgi:hypothetical protein